MPATTAPNFLVILTDDQGPWAMSRTFPELVTPVLDNLVAHGTTFNNYYCASPVCSPARASLLTGRMPSAHGVHDWLIGERHPDALEEPYIEGVMTLPEILQQAGYTCAMSGKWHIGTSRAAAPGFTHWYAHRLGGGPYYGAPIWDEDGQPTTEPTYFTDAVASKASEFLKVMATSETPFYLQVNFTAPHDPWLNNHPAELYDLYKGCTFDSIPREEPHEWTRVYDDFSAAFADPVSHLQGYAASLSGVDRALGMLLDRLSELGVAEETVVIFLSDNGFSCGQHGIWGKGNGTWPLNFWENSVRVPFVVRLPGQRERREVDEHVSACSFLATVCELAGVTPPDDPLRAADSVADLVKGRRRESSADDVMVFDEYGGGRMIRRGAYKYIHRHDGPCELFNLDIDPEERTNLVDDPTIRDVRDDLRNALEVWFAQHETATNKAFHRSIRGRGQIHPPHSGYGDARTYEQGYTSHDGVRA